MNSAVGESGVSALQSMTIPQFLKRTVGETPDGKALCWKDNKEDPWQSLTFTQYMKLIYDTVKSFLKVSYPWFTFCMCCCVYIAWTGTLPCCWYSGFQLCGVVCI